MELSTIPSGRESTALQGVERVSESPVVASKISLGWTGRLAWEDGTPASGVVIRARHPDTDLPLCQAQSDDTGHYRLALKSLFDGYREFEEIDLSCDGYYAKEPTWPNARPSIPFSVVDIVLERGTPLEVKAIHKVDGTPAAGVWINANCETEWWHEVWGQTDEFGLLQVHLPHLGPWAFMGLEAGVAIAPEATFWLKPGDQGVTLELLDLPQSLNLVAQDLETGTRISQASFHGARVPDDVRQIPDQAYVELPTSLTAENGALKMPLQEAGRVFVKVKAEGYFPEVAEIVLASEETFSVPMVPLENVQVSVTRQGKAVAAKMLIGFNRHPILFPTSEESESLALQPQCAPLLRFDLPAKKSSTVQLPKQGVATSPQSFDLWIEWEGGSKYFGVIHRESLPPQPWVFELDPPMGKVVVKVRNKEGEPLVGENMQISHQIEEGARDAASISKGGRLSGIFKTDAMGEIHASFAAPCEVVVSANMVFGSVAAGRLEVGDELLLEIQMEKPFDPNTEEALLTSGRVQFEGAIPQGLSYESLAVSIMPDKFFGEYMIFLGAQGEWSSELPAGNYTASVDSDASSNAEGHQIRFEAGTENNLLLLPSPSGLLLNIREMGSGKKLMADDVDLWVDGKWLTYMEAYADGSAGSQMLFADRVQFDVEKQGYVPAFGVVDLRRGVITQHEVVLQPARTLTFDYARKIEGLEETYLLWLDPPQRADAFVVHVFSQIWDKAPTDACRLQAIDSEHQPIGPVFTVESGLADLSLQVPLF